MGAPNVANSRGERGAGASRSTPDLFSANFKPRSASALVYAMITCLAGAVSCIIFSFEARFHDHSAMPFVRDYLNADNAGAILSVGLCMLLSCALLAAAEMWLRHYMPMRHEVVNDFIRGMQSCGVIPVDLRVDEFEWKIHVFRFRRKAYVWFRLRYPNRSYEDMLPMVAGLGTAFRRARRVTPDRANDPYTMALVVDYGDGDE